MAIEIINVGSSPNDGNGDALRDAFIKCNDNFDELDTTKIGGSGTDNYVPKFNGTDAIENSSIFDNGNLGVGTTNPLGILHLYESGATTRVVVDGDAGQSKIITYRTGGLQRFGMYVNNTSESGSNAGSDFQIRAYSDAGSLLSTPFFIKRSTGNIGIGTTSPTSLSDRFGLSVNGTNGGFADFMVSGTSKGRIIADANNFYIQGLANGSLIFESNSTERMRITSSGNVGIGTTSPSSALDVNGNVRIGSGTLSVPAYSFRNSTNTGFYLTDDGTGALINVGIGANNVATFKHNGNVSIGTTSPDASAILHLRSSSKGFLPPTMSQGERDSIGGPADGLVIYNTDTQTINVFTSASGWKSLLYI